MMRSSSPGISRSMSSTLSILAASGSSTRMAITACAHRHWAARLAQQVNMHGTDDDAQSSLTHQATASSQVVWNDSHAPFQSSSPSSIMA